ncbi:MAG: four helix bundle protein [Polyangiaceae bacterium]|nr:four helix bundle protein [Polyangiaceae bacterium]
MQRYRDLKVWQRSHAVVLQLRYRDLKVWQRSHAVVLQLDRLTGSLPAEERYGIVSQLRRAAVSVRTNIAEGSKRRSKAQFAHLLNVAEGSLAEVEYLVQLSGDLAYLTHDVVGT